MPTKRSARPTTPSCGPVQHVDSVFGSSPAPPRLTHQCRARPQVLRCAPCSCRPLQDPAVVERSARRAKKRPARPATTSRGRVQHPNYSSGTSAAVPSPHVDGMLVRCAPWSGPGCRAGCSPPPLSIEARDARKTACTPRDDVARSRAVPELRVRHLGSRSPAPRRRRARPQVVRCAPWPGLDRSRWPLTACRPLRSRRRAPR